MEKVLSARVVWAVLAAVGSTGAPLDSVTQRVAKGAQLDEQDVVGLIHEMMAGGHLYLEADNTLHRVPNSGTRLFAKSLGVSAAEASRLFHEVQQAVLTNDRERLDKAMATVAQLRAAQDAKGVKEQWDA